MEENIKKRNIQAYTNNQRNFIARYAKFPPRIQDIDNAFSLYSWGKNINELEVLELWCFVWREYSQIMKYTERYVWIDIQDKAITYAQNLYGKEKFICWDFTDITFKNKIDIIFSFASLLHCDKDAMQKMLWKLYNTLNLGGIIYMSLKYSKSYKVLNEIEWWRVFYLYNIEEFKHICWESYTIIYEDIHKFNNQDWFTIVLKKN